MSGFALPSYVAEMIATLEQAGFEALAVGGCVRDLLLGRQPKDYDIATSALPEQVAGAFAHTVPTGVKYGTTTVLLGDHKAEVTTFRSEAGYEDHRRPGEVRFGVGLEGDLSRRDFTINAMAYHPRRGLLDLFGGREDLAQKKIRAVGEPGERFCEDALRILRAFRFAAELGFEIEPTTLVAASAHMPLCGRLSGERIRVELDRLLLSSRPELIFALAEHSLFETLGLPADGGQGRGLVNTPCVRHARWAAFLFLSGCDPQGLMNRLKFDNSTRSNVNILLRTLTRPLPQTPAGLKRELRDSGPLLSVAIVTAGALTGADISAKLRELSGILRRREPYCLAMLAVSGEDLLQVGVTPGPVCGQFLIKLLDHVIEHPQDNTQETLLGLAEGWRAPE